MSRKVSDAHEAQLLICPHTGGEGQIDGTLSGGVSGQSAATLQPEATFHAGKVRRMWATNDCRAHTQL